MSDQIYVASVYKRTVKYTNFNGVTQERELFFALDPLQLLSVIASFEPKKSKSKNPAKQNEIEPLTGEQQVKFIRDICSRAAGFPSDNGEVWEPFEGFLDHLAGQTFVTQLTSSDADRKEFTEKVVLDPFRAFVGFAKNDPSNSKNEIDNLLQQLATLEKVFAEPVKPDETLEERRARLEAELKAMESTED